MELPSPTDPQLQQALLSAIHRSPDGTAVAEELHTIVEKDLSLIVADDQKRNWTNTISFALIKMRDEKFWLRSPYYKPATKENKFMKRKWLEANRPGIKAEQQIWTITEKGVSVIHEGASIDQQIPSKKSTPAGSHSKLAGPLVKKGGGKRKDDEARDLMSTYYHAHSNEIPKNIDQQREFIIDLLMKGMSVEDAFSMALKKTV